MKRILATLWALSLLMIGGSAIASTLYQQDFEINAAGVSGGGAVEGSQGYSALGFGSNLWHNDGFSSTVVTLNLAQGVSTATLTASLAIIDSWDNGSYCCGPDAFSVKLDGNTLFSVIFDNYLGQGPTLAPGLTTLSYGTALGFNGSFNDAAYGLSLALGGLAAGTHTLEFLGSGPGYQGGSDESYGIDNLFITATVPEPGSAAMLLAGLLGIGWGATRRRRGRR